MAMNGIAALIYGVEDVALCTHYFTDFGLNPVETSKTQTVFRLDEGSEIILRHVDDPSLPPSDMKGSGVREIVWGVDELEDLQRFKARLPSHMDVRTGENDALHFSTSFGIPMAIRILQKRPVVYAPDPINAPGVVRRLNQHRKWRERARPKVINHVVFAVPNYQDAADFMLDTLGFRLSDHQKGFGMYIRCEGSNNHHNLLLINANAPFPGMDGSLAFHHTNFGVEDIDEIMIGANYMNRRGWEPSHQGLGRHRIDSALFYYLPCPAGGEAEYGADADYVDQNWVPREFTDPLFAYAHFVHNLPPFLQKPPAWNFHYLTTDAAISTEEETSHAGH